MVENRFALAGIEKHELNKDGSGLFLTFKTDKGPMLISLHWTSISDLITALANSAKRLHEFRGDEGYVVPEVFNVVSGFSISDHRDGHDIGLMVTTGDLQYNFLLPKGMRTPSGKTLPEALAEQLLALRDRPHGGH